MPVVPVVPVGPVVPGVGRVVVVGVVAGSFCLFPCWSSQAMRPTIAKMAKARIMDSPSCASALGDERISTSRVAFSVGAVGTPAGRARKIAALVAALGKGEPIVPPRKK
jgi:hypothetical protein